MLALHQPSFPALPMDRRAPPTMGFKLIPQRLPLFFVLVSALNPFPSFACCWLSRPLPPNLLRRFLPKSARSMRRATIRFLFGCWSCISTPPPLSLCFVFAGFPGMRFPLLLVRLRRPDLIAMGGRQGPGSLACKCCPIPYFFFFFPPTLS